MNTPSGSPVPEGVVSTEAVISRTSFVPKLPLVLGKAKALTELLTEYVFFTPAVLYLYGGFCDAPLADFVAAYPGTEFYYHKFSKALFTGLDARSNGDKSWNYVLWAIRREYWDAFSAWLISTTLTYEEDKMVARIGEQALTVADPLANTLVYGAVVTRVPVTAFGIRGSKYVAALLANDKPRLVLQAGDAEMVILAQALYGGAVSDLVL